MVREILDGVTLGIFLQQRLLLGRVGGGIFRMRTGIYQSAAQASGIRTDVYQIVGSPHDLLVVLHHYHGVAQFLQLSQHLDQSVGVTAVQTDARLIQDIHAAHQRGSQVGGQVDALAFTSRKGVGQSVERKISQSHIQQELQAMGNLGEQALGYLLLVVR